MRTSVLTLTAHAAPLACAAHCLAVPLLAVSWPLLASPGAEWALLAPGALLPLGMALEALRHHRRVGPPLAVLAAIAAWALSLAGGLEPLPEEVATLAACAGLAAASFWGARLRHRASCRACACPAGHHGEGA